MHGAGTGKFQLNDVGIQRIVKHIFQTAAANYLVEETWKQFTRNPGAIVNLNFNIAPLRNATVEWGLSAYYYLKEHPQIVQQV